MGAHVWIKTSSLPSCLQGTKLTWRWIKYLELLFPLLFIAPISFPQAPPAWFSWAGDLWAREQAPFQSAQGREINKSPRPDACQSHVHEWSQAGRASADGKSGLFTFFEICFGAWMFCQPWLHTPLLQAPTVLETFLQAHQQTRLFLLHRTEKWTGGLRDLRGGTNLPQVCLQAS